VAFADFGDSKVVAIAAVKAVTPTPTARLPIVFFLSTTSLSIDSSAPVISSESSLTLAARVTTKEARREHGFDSRTERRTDCRGVIAHFDPAETRASAARATRFAAILEMAVICVIGGDESFQVTTRERGRSRRAGAAPDSDVLSHYLRFFLSESGSPSFLTNPGKASSIAPSAAWSQRVRAKERQCVRHDNSRDGTQRHRVRGDACGCVLVRGAQRTSTRRVVDEIDSM